VGLGQAGDRKAVRAIGEKALELAQTFTDESEHHTALHVLASLQARAKDVEGALKTASRMKKEGITYPNIAHEQAKAGDVKGALATVKEHLPESGWWHDKTLQGIASVQTERGEEKEALAWARLLSSPTARGSALLGVAQGLVKRHKIGVGHP